MNARIVVDPVTRIEGHLRIEAQMNGNQIQQAYSSGTMVRGIEIILRDRDPTGCLGFRAAHLRRVHAGARHRIGSRPSKMRSVARCRRTQQLIRNLMIGAQYIHDHVMHFYHLHALDWVDVVSALKADPAATAALAQSLEQLPAFVHRLFQGRAEESRGFRRRRTAGHFRESLLGTPRVQAAAGSEPDGGCALPGCARMATRCRTPARDLRRQEPAPEFRCRRRALPDRSELRFCDQQQAAQRGSGHHQQDEVVR